MITSMVCDVLRLLALSRRWLSIDPKIASKKILEIAAGRQDLPYWLEGRQFMRIEAAAVQARCALAGEPSQLGTSNDRRPGPIWE